MRDRSMNGKTANEIESRAIGSVGGTLAEKWNKRVREIDEKIRRDGPWASARLKPLNRGR